MSTSQACRACKSARACPPPPFPSLPHPPARPHLPKMSRYMYQLAPNVDRFTPHPSVSANADVLVWYVCTWGTAGERMEAGGGGGGGGGGVSDLRPRSVGRRRQSRSHLPPPILPERCHRVVWLASAPVPAPRVFCRHPRPPPPPPPPQHPPPPPLTCPPLRYFGWALRTPIIRTIVQLWFRMPGTPTVCSWLATHLPKRPVRGRCAGVECFTDEGFPSISIRKSLRRKAEQATLMWRETKPRIRDVVRRCWPGGRRSEGEQQLLRLVRARCLKLAQPAGDGGPWRSFGEWGVCGGSADGHP